MQMNKQWKLSFKNVLSLHERHSGSCDRGSVASQHVTRMFRSKNSRQLPQGSCMLFLYTPTLCISITFVTSRSSASLFWWEKHCACAGEQCWLICAPTSCFSTATHGPSHQFCLKFWACDTLPLVFQCTLIPEPKIY